MGASAIPFMGPAAVAAGALTGLAGSATSFSLGILTVPGAAELAVALGVSLLVAEAGRWGVQMIGRRRRRLIRKAQRGAEQGRGGAIVAANLAGAVPTAVFGVVLVGSGLAVGCLLLSSISRVPSADGRWVALVVLGLGVGQTVTLAARGKRVLGWFGLVTVLVLGVWIWGRVGA
jgi:hypothetical protein